MTNNKQVVVNKGQAPKKDETFVDQPVEISKTFSAEEFQDLVNQYDSVCITFYQIMQQLKQVTLNASRLSASLNEICNGLEVKLSTQQQEKLNQHNAQIQAQIAAQQQQVK